MGGRTQRWCQGEVSRWAERSRVVRLRSETSIEVDGQRIFNEVPQAPLASHGWGPSSNDTYSYFNFVSQYYNF